MGTFWTGHIITTAIGSGVPFLVWAITQLSWVSGPAALLLFAFVTCCTATLLAVAESYRTGDPDKGKRNYPYMDAVRSNRSGAKVAICGVIRYANLVGVAIGYTIASSISMKAIRRAGCFHSNGHAEGCKSSSTPYMILFSAVLILFSQIPDFDQIWWLSIVAAVMSFTYSSIGLSLGIAQTIYNGGFMGSLTGISNGAGVNSAQVWHTVQTFGDIACAYFLSYILVEIHDTIKAQVMQKATCLSVPTTTIFYMLCGCMGYAAFGDAAPENLLNSFGFWVNLVLCNRSPSSRCVLIQAILSVMLSSACLVLAEYMCIWREKIACGWSALLPVSYPRTTDVMLSPACCIGRRVQMPRTDAVMGSGKCKCIGRAREAAPAGCSHGIPTFTRAGDCSPPPPRKCDWFLIMGSTAINTDDSCVISAVVMCMEAQYRVLNGKYHGAKSCFLKVMTEVVESLKVMCYERKAWKRYVGAPTVQGVLEVIRSLKKGIPTVYDDISLRLKSYVSFEAGDLSHLEVTSMIQKKGPVIGVLYAGGEAYVRSTVYRGGDRALRANHAVVCTGYRYVDGELCIIIMDNVNCAGPFRFVLCEAFKEFHVLTIDTLAR